MTFMSDGEFWSFVVGVVTGVAGVALLVLLKLSIDEWKETRRSKELEAEVEESSYRQGIKVDLRRVNDRLENFKEDVFRMHERMASFEDALKGKRK